MPRVLVVDDDEAIRSLLTEMLQDEGYEVFQGKNGAEAVRLATEARPDVIIMDLRMPVMSGVEAIQLIKHNPETAAMPILAMSAGTVLVAEVRNRQLPVQGLIDKPFDLDAMLAHVALQLQLVPAEQEPV